MFPLLVSLMTGYLLGLVYPFTYGDTALLFLGLVVLSKLSLPCWMSAVIPLDLSGNRRRATSRQAVVLCLVCLFGAFYMQHSLMAKMGSKVSVAEQGLEIALVGDVVGKPRETLYGWQSTFRSEKRLLVAYWPTTLRPQTGDRWSISCVLQQINPVLSPGAVDPSKQAFLKGVDGRCSIKSGIRLQSSASWTVQWQSTVQQWINSQPFEGTYKAYVTALLLGDRSQLDDRQRQLMREAHTSHLLVVSGLHLSLVFALFFTVSGWIGRMLLVQHIRPLSDFQWAAGIVAATIYAALCDFPLPTQRALVMLTVPAFLHFMRRGVSWGTAYVLALGSVLLWDPLALMQFSAWLSFGAVAALMLGMRSRPVTSKSTSVRLKTVALMWIKPQWLVALALAPVLWLMGVASNPASVLVNLIAIPLVAFGLLPGLMAVFFLSFVLPSAPILWAVVWINHGFDALERVMVWGGQYQLSTVPTDASIGLFGLWVVVMLTPAGLPGKMATGWVVLVVFVIRLLWTTAPSTGLELYVLDVGLGQATLVRQDAHWIMIDSGPGLIEGGGQLARVVMPFLRKQGVKQLDAVIFSHHDTDHIGGLDNAPTWLNSALWLFGEPVKGTYACQVGQQWQFGPMQVKILSPGIMGTVEGNAASCVVQVTSPDGCVLIPGDIDKLTEYAVLSRLDLSSQHRCPVLVGSHHGSTSSTTHAWLTTFSPTLMVFSAGRNNRFGHPNREVTDKLAAHAIPWRSTHVDGTLKIVQTRGIVEVDALVSPFFYWQ